MRDPLAAGHHAWSSARVAAAAGALVLLAATSSAQAEIKVNDTTSFRLGALFQPQADWTQDATGGYEQNLFLRRARVLLGGQLSRNVTFFLESDNANLGKVVTGTKEISTGFTLQDAFVEWKVAGGLWDYHRSERPEGINEGHPVAAGMAALSAYHRMRADLPVDRLVELVTRDLPIVAPGAPPMPCRRFSPQETCSWASTR